MDGEEYYDSEEVKSLIEAKNKTLFNEH